ncbi:uncharacterized protein LOC132644049 [Lycium barbarum]|uniref:uncharacterized protein LOC132644049 n=1 Tax=Lycium barbarum TaxID=112863 RepID=UPI00293E02CF|nr:uncharacterized protein LOC132644049 [Lycium barbarum]
MGRHKLEFAVGDQIFLKVSPMKVVMQFGRKGKLSPHFIGPCEIVRRIGRVTYGLKLSSEMAMVHPVFHFSMLRLYNPAPSHVLSHEEIEVNEGLSYEEEHVQILDRQVRRMRTKDIASVKVLWRNHNTEEEIPSPISHSKYVLNLLVIGTL